jgi:hypothetical protein
MTFLMKPRLLWLTFLCACLVSGSLFAQTRPKEGECKADEVDMGDYCAGLPPATTQPEKERRRVTRFRGESMMPGRIGEAESERVPADQPPAGIPPSPEAVPQDPASGYSVQLGAFSTRELAESVVHSIESPGSPVTVVPLERGDRILWACMMGPFPDKGSALIARDQIRKDKKFRTAYIKPPQAGLKQETANDTTQK